MIILPYLIVGLVGLMAGWLTNLLAERFPRPEKPLFGQLHCVQSGEPLAVRDYLPIIGFALQRGKCRHCGKSLPWRFPLVEAAVAISFMLAWPMYETNPLYTYIVNAFYIFLLATIALIDWRYRLIFPIMTWIGCLVAIGMGIFAGTQPSSLYIDGPNFILPDSPVSVILGIVFGGGIFYAVYWIAFAMYKKRALGFGDVLLAIMIGAIMGMPRAASALFLGAVLGGCVALGFFFFGGKRWRDFIPYGTTLCIGVIMIIIWGQHIWNWGPFGLLTGLLQLINLIFVKLIFGDSLGLIA